MLQWRKTVGTKKKNTIICVGKISIKISDMTFINYLMTLFLLAEYWSRKETFFLLLLLLLFEVRPLAELSRLRSLDGGAVVVDCCSPDRISLTSPNTSPGSLCPGLDTMFSKSLERSGSSSESDVLSLSSLPPYSLPSSSSSTTILFSLATFALAARCFADTLCRDVAEDEEEDEADEAGIAEDVSELIAAFSARC
jgi:hypothetical protein